jgi:hypothetical protein
MIRRSSSDLFLEEEHETEEDIQAYESESNKMTKKHFDEKLD